MREIERITIDVTVARDYQDSKRRRHAQALELFELARQGSIELSIAPQGYRLDVTGDLAEQLDAALANEGVAEAPQLAYPSEATYPGENLFPGAYVDGFADAWEAVVESWHSHEGNPPSLKDRFHVETHVLDGRDIFLTDDGPLLVMCRRLHDEHAVNVVGMRLRDYLIDAHTRRA